MNKLGWAIVAIIIIGLGWWGLSKNDDSALTETGPIKFGVIGPFTGDAAAYGEPLRNTIQIAVDEINGAGGVGGRQLEPIFEDGKCEGAPAVSAAHKLIDTDGVQFIIGGFCSGETLPVVPIAEKAKVFVFSTSASSPALTGISSFFARSYPSDAAQGKVLAEIAQNDKGWKKVAMIQEQTDYAAGIYKAFSSSFSGETVKEEFPSNATDFRSALTKLKAAKPDALFVVTQTAAAAQRILKQLQELGWKPQMILNDVPGGDKPLVKEYASLLEGALTAEFVPNESNPKLQALVSKYKTRYGQDLPYLGYMSIGYDTVYLLKDGITTVGNNGEKLAAWSRTIKDWQGSSGSITIQSDGDRASGHKA